MPKLTSKFFERNRRNLRKKLGYNLPIILTANSYMQSSVDRPYPFVQDSNFWYLIGSREPGIMAILSADDEYLVVPSRSSVRKAFEGEVDYGELSKVSGIEKIYETEDGWKILGGLIKKAKKIGTLKPPAEYMEAIDMFTNPSRARLLKKIKDLNEGVEIVDLRPILSNLRMVKSSEEIEAITNAVEHTANLFKIIEAKREYASSENELAAEMMHYLMINQLEFAFEPIVASGANSVTLHYEKNNQKLQRRAPLLIDIGVRCGGYASDVTRTVFDAPSQRQTEIYQAVMNVHKYAREQLAPGIKLKEYESKVLQAMGEQLIGLGLIKNISPESVRRYYPHSTSHFLGIDVHDTGDYDCELEPGVVLTVEPGIYIKEEGIGVRIEDDILITEKGNRLLTGDLPKAISSLTITSQDA